MFLFLQTCFETPFTLCRFRLRQIVQSTLMPFNFRPGTWCPQQPTQDHFIQYSTPRLDVLRKPWIH
uniref:Uncharacterized protein n=1 Tax=Anguilla anguilla TaxID=7936 RepID=A0A0E9RQN4_ANGAN